MAKKKPEKRRPDGDGTIWIDPNGQRWAILSLKQLTEGRDTRRLRRKVTPNTQAAAEKLLRDLKAQALASVANSVDASRPVTLQDACDLWIKINSPKYARNTILAYEKSISKFGSMLPKNLEQITVRDVETWINQIRSRYASQSALTIFGVLKGVLDMCVRYDYLAKNPAQFVDAPKIDREAPTRNQDPWTLEEITAILDHLANNKRTNMYVIVRLALECALRVGEVSGLSWDHVDFENKTVNVVRQLILDKTKGGSLYFSTPKSAAGKRTVPISDDMVQLLKAHKKHQDTEARKIYELRYPGEPWNPQNLVFLTHTGGAVSPPTVSTQFSIYIKRHGFRYNTFHSLRKTAATVMSDAGVPVRTVQGFLGHENPTTTLKIYARLTAQGMQHGIDVFSSLLNKKDESTEEGTNGSA